LKFKNRFQRLPNTNKSCLKCSRVKSKYLYKIKKTKRKRLVVKCSNWQIFLKKKEWKEANCKLTYHTSRNCVSCMKTWRIGMIRAKNQSLVTWWIYWAFYLVKTKSWVKVHKTLRSNLFRTHQANCWASTKLRWTF